jgi:hypothetical protein
MPETGTGFRVRFRVSLLSRHRDADNFLRRDRVINALRIHSCPRVFNLALEGVSICVCRAKD